MSESMELALFPWLDSPGRSGATTPLRNVFLHVTKACNLRCRYCYFSAARPEADEMTRSEFARLWRDVAELKPEKIVFTGGEPLLRADLRDLLRDLAAADSEHAVLRCVNTNGHLMTRALARELVGLADEIRVSLDALSERNDALRGRGNFRAAMRALEQCYAVGFEPKVLITVTAASLPDLESLIVLLLSLRITRINLNLFRPLGRGAGHDEWLIDPERVAEAARRAWILARPDAPPPIGAPEPETQKHCGVGQYLNVMPNGDVYPCHALIDPAFRVGSVRSQSLLSICRRDGLLGRLAGLDFRALTQRDPALAPLTRPSACMGLVHEQTRDRTAWQQIAGPARYGARD